MARIRMNVLDRDDEDRIHENSLMVLNELGVMVHSSSVLEILENGGANVDFKTGIAQIPESMVQEALDKAPKRFKLCARDSKNDLEIPAKNFPFVSTDGLTVYLRDLDTGEKRSARRSDLGELAKLADALEAISFFWPIVTVSDVPEISHTIHEQWTSLQNCTMHVQGDSISAQDAKMQVELAKLIVGSEEELRKRPIFSVTSCPIAPLSFEKGAVEGQVEFARAGIPVLSMSMSLSGSSSPVTLAGTILNANAENLASLVITQFAAPGAPHIYSSESAPIDMQTGNISYLSPESLPINAAMGQLARRYSRPCMVAAWGVGGELPGISIPFTSLAGMCLSTLGTTDLVTGMGGLDKAKGCSFEQLVIDAYLWDNFRPFMRDFIIDDESLAVDVMKEVGHGSSYLMHPHTAREFRKVLHFNDKDKLALETMPANKMIPEARRIAKKLLKEHEVPQIDKDIVEQGDKLIRNYEKNLIA